MEFSISCFNLNKNETRASTEKLIKASKHHFWFLNHLHPVTTHLRAHRNIFSENSQLSINFIPLDWIEWRSCLLISLNTGWRCEKSEPATHTETIISHSRLVGDKWNWKSQQQPHSLAPHSKFLDPFLSRFHHHWILIVCQARFSLVQLFVALFSAFLAFNSAQQKPPVSLYCPLCSSLFWLT